MSKIANAAPAEVQQDGAVRVRVLPLGAGRIFTGETRDTVIDPADRYPTHARGAVFATGAATAAALEARGYAEVMA